MSTSSRSLASLTRSRAECSAEGSIRMSAGAAPERLEVGPHARVPVDGDELAFALEIGRQQRRMAARAEGGVDDRLPRLHVEQPPHFFREDRDVISRAGLQ